MLYLKLKEILISLFSVYMYLTKVTTVLYQHSPTPVCFNAFMYLCLVQTVFRIVVLGIWDYIENKVEVSACAY